MRIGSALRRTLELIGEGAVEFTGFRVVAVSLVDGDAVEVVTVTGNEDAVRHLSGARVPLHLLLDELDAAERWGSLRFLPAERASDNLAGHEWIPPMTPIDAPDAWRPEDLLCGLLCDPSGRLRGLFTVDMPVEGRRPDAAQRRMLQRFVRLAERGLVTELERTAIQEQMEKEYAIAEYRRTLLGALSHEFRASAAAINNTVDLLRRRRAEPGDPHSRALDRMNRDANRIRSIVDDMAALARLGEPGRRAPRTRVDLSEVVVSAVARHQVSANLDEVQLVVEVHQDLQVLGDREELGHMAANLVSNAIKYSESGGRVFIGLRAASPAGAPERLPEADGDPQPMVVLTVADNGIGIAQEDLPHLYEEFFRSAQPAVRTRGGAGLGLAIVERVVRQHDGVIDVDSEPGSGTTVAVRLPRVITAPATWEPTR